MRLITALLLSVVLAIGSIAMAVAHYQTPLGRIQFGQIQIGLTAGGGQILTLCSSEGDATVTLDQNGNPVPASPHLCPDCLTAAIVFNLSDPTALLVPTRRARALTVTHGALVLPSARPPTPAARGPPRPFV